MPKKPSRTPDQIRAGLEAKARAMLVKIETDHDDGLLAYPTRVYREIAEAQEKGRVVSRRGMTPAEMVAVMLGSEDRDLIPDRDGPAYRAMMHAREHGDLVTVPGETIDQKLAWLRERRGAKP